MVARHELVGQTVRIQWTATATNVNGVATGALEATVGKRVFGIADLATSRKKKTG